MLTIKPDITVENVAMAIYDAETWDGYTSSNGMIKLKWGAIPVAKREPFYRLARAALKAMASIESEVLK